MRSNRENARRLELFTRSFYHLSITTTDTKENTSSCRNLWLKNTLCIYLPKVYTCPLEANDSKFSHSSTIECENLFQFAAFLWPQAHVPIHLHLTRASVTRSHQGPRCSRYISLSCILTGLQLFPTPKRHMERTWQRIPHFTFVQNYAYTAKSRIAWAECGPDNVLISNTNTNTFLWQVGNCTTGICSEPRVNIRGYTDAAMSQQLIQGIASVLWTCYLRAPDMCTRHVCIPAFQLGLVALNH